MGWDLLTLKIAFVCPRYWPSRGGVERYVREIATRLTSNNEVEVLTTDPHGKLPTCERVQGVQVKRFRAWAPSDTIHFSLSMFNYLRKFSDSYDIVHANSYHGLPAYYAAECKGSNKLVLSPHFHGTVGHTRIATLLHIPYKLLGRSIFEKADSIVCSSRFEMEEILRAFRIPINRLVRIEEGIIPIPRVTEPQSKQEKAEKTILCVSRFEKYKGIQHIIAALPHLPEVFNLTLIGSGPYTARLSELVNQLSLQERVMMKHDLTEDALYRSYEEADVAVLLSQHEAYSLFVGEALSAGLPCVVANQGALEEWVDGENCVGVDNPTNPKAVAEAILRVTGRRVNRSVPNWDDYVQRLVEVYEQVLQS